MSERAFAKYFLWDDKMERNVLFAVKRGMLMSLTLNMLFQSLLGGL